MKQSSLDAIWMRADMRTRNGTIINRDTKRVISGKFPVRGSVLTDTLQGSGPPTEAAPSDDDWVSD
jgi:hypothetical protein